MTPNSEFDSTPTIVYGGGYLEREPHVPLLQRDINWNVIASIALVGYIAHKKGTKIALMSAVIGAVLMMLFGGL